MEYLPEEVQWNIYKFLGKHPIAEMFEEKTYSFFRADEFEDDDDKRICLYNKHNFGGHVLRRWREEKEREAKQQMEIQKWLDKRKAHFFRQ